MKELRDLNDLTTPHKGLKQLPGLQGQNLALTVFYVPHILIPTSIKNNPFLKLILLEQTPLLTCSGCVPGQKWLVSRRINLRKALLLIDVGVNIGRHALFKNGSKSRPEPGGSGTK